MHRLGGIVHKLESTQKPTRHLLIRLTVASITEHSEDKEPGESAIETVGQIRNSIADRILE